MIRGQCDFAEKLSQQSRVMSWRRYQLPVFGIDAQGSSGAFAPPAWSSSTEIPSGERTNAIRPSRGGREIVTPWSIKRRQAA